MNEAQIILFLVTSVAVILVPGQDLVLVLSRGVGQGVSAGISTAAGVSLGLLGHTMLAAFGFGAILMASELLFALVKYIGAAYLVYLGISLIRSNRSGLALGSARAGSLKRAFLTGALSNISNPKITIFYLAFLPQFIAADTQHPALLLFVLGATFALLTFLIKVPVGYFAGRSAGWIQERPQMITWLDRISGGVLIGLGIKLAFEEV